MSQDYQRMIDGAHTPTEKEITDFIGEPAKTAWTEITRFIKEHYDIMPDIMFGGSKYGWEVRYRKSGKTLCTLTPEKGAVRILIALGKQESEEALSMRNELSPKLYKLIEDTSNCTTDAGCGLNYLLQRTLRT